MSTLLGSRWHVIDDVEPDLWRVRKVPETPGLCATSRSRPRCHNRRMCTMPARSVGMAVPPRRYGRDLPRSDAPIFTAMGCQTVWLLRSQR
jgi:hypothetical protein